MDRKDFEKALAGGSLPSVLLFEGDEEQLLQHFLEGCHYGSENLKKQ